MKNIRLIRGKWRCGRDRVAPATARTLCARGVCRLWIPITPETRIPKTYEVIGASPHPGAPSGWCWEVRPRVRAAAILAVQREPRDLVSNAAKEALHKVIGADLAAMARRLARD